MKIFGQPSDYSEMLERVFFMSIVSGFVCTVLLAIASPTFHRFIDSFRFKGEIGFIKGVSALYYAIPFFIVFVIRVLKLHNRISDVFKIRFYFDTEYLLFPLAQGSGILLSPELKNKIRRARGKAMGKVFYPYASFIDPVIDKQLVRTAADNWGWFWVFVESIVIFGGTSVVLAMLQTWRVLIICGFVILLEFIFLRILWSDCKRSANRQIEAILEDCGREKDISQYFLSL